MKSARRFIAAWVALCWLTVSAGARADALTGSSPPALSAPERSQLRSLELRLDEVAMQEAGTSAVLPWAVVALGVGATLLGLGVGAYRVASCDGSCTGPFWPGWLVVGGGTATTAGLIWLRLLHEDLAELKSRRYQLQMQIDAYEIVRQGRGEQAVLRVQGSF